MSSTTPTPIYQQLVDEQGDVLTDSRETAEQIRRQAERALSWHGQAAPVAPAPDQGRTPGAGS
ncbi:hypothetical protein [Streptomyces tsukubensis]|uniref:Uncharacterized protein n=1 Tax=Streptomyces tsukubensis TaxID=83656 RepID=A0A1V4AFZ7_9ACTN|nr:hypothetical protein [Streptomyces tsukubensis]OON82531.1 hypothetical protein B1H18_00070 [Streptomyces tsukubensis]